MVSCAGRALFGQASASITPSGLKPYINSFGERPVAGVYALLRLCCNVGRSSVYGMSGSIAV